MRVFQQQKVRFGEQQNGLQSLAHRHTSRACRRDQLIIRAAGNTFGHTFRVTTFGESHGKGVGCVVDGVPPRLPITIEEIQVPNALLQTER